MTSSEPGDSLERQAIDVFAEFLDHGQNERASFDHLLKQHPRLEGELSRLRDNLAKLDGFLEPQGSAIQDAPAQDIGGSAPTTNTEQGSILESLSRATDELNRYSAEAEVGRGGMGVVTRSWDSRLRRQIAMKVLRNSEGSGSGTSSLDPRRIRRFLEEVQITGQLDHPGVVPVHELGVDKDGQLFFTMRLVRGRDLREIFKLARLEADGWNRARALSSLQRVCETMAFAHEHGVIHRDLKPANIMVGSHGETYVMDWGLAKVLDRSKLHVSSTGSSESLDQSAVPANDAELESDALLTNEGTVIGTPSYMPPEQARGELASIGPASDVYAAGAMLYHLLQGHPPYLNSGEQISSSRVLDQLLVGPPAPLDPTANAIPLELAAICERAMSRKPIDRYADMGEMATDLRAFLEGRVVRAYKTGAVAEFQTWVKRNRGTAGSIAAGFVIAIGGLVSTAVVQARSNRALESKNTELMAARAEAVFEAERAKQNEALALASERAANEERTKVLRLSDLEQVEVLRRAANTLYPARPERLPELNAWMEEANALSDRLPLHREHLESLQALASQAETAPGPVDGSASALVFSSNEQQWHYNQLIKLTSELDEFLDPEHGLRAAIGKRLEFARAVDQLTVSGAEAERLWARAIQSIQDPDQCPLYRGLALQPQLGLLPIGRSEHSGLWEFLLPETGEAPQLQMDGTFLISEETGVVLVLMPGASSRMGSRRPDATHSIGDPFVDPFAAPSEQPVHSISLDPFFISKYELTQAQWFRLADDNPSVCAAGSSGPGIEPYTWINPVDNVTQIEAVEILGQYGMTLPTEAQWEFSARAGTSSVFWNGNDSASMNGATNCADLTLVNANPMQDRVVHAPWSDGWIGSAPVGSYYPNPFGLHDTAGNLWEWCLDMSSSYRTNVEPGTGLRRGGNARYRIVRGGSFNEDPENLRSALREQYAPDARSLDVGVRPVVRLSE